jgi:colanic acid biosynthesis glycosyl transferase WcaI
MKVIVWGINYRPESTGIAPFNAELAEFLNQEEHDVSVVTGFPYYPQWRKTPGDRRLYRTERINGINVHRCGLYVPRRVSTLKRIVHELSFGLSSLLRVLFLPRADVYVVVSPPLCLGFFAWLALLVKRSPYVFHVQDLQPGAAVGLGMVKGRTFIRILFALEAFAYRHAAAVSGISDGMMAEFRRKGVPARKRVYFPNWLRGGGGAPQVARGEFRRRFHVPPGDLLAVYSGNLGRKQGIEILLETAQQLHGTGQPAGITLVIAGAGAEREALAARVAALNLPGLRLLPLLSDEEYAMMLADADVGLITQASGTGQFFFPSKLLSLLQAGVPVATVADEDSELARAVADGGFGVNVAPGDAAALTAALAQLAAERGALARLAAQTRWVQRFSPALVLPQYAQALARVIAGTQPTPELVEQHEPSGV